MQTKPINSAVQELLNTPDTRDLPPKPFKFNEALDMRGLPLESADYVKKNCKRCLGRGYETRLIGNGYKNGKQLQARSVQACSCVHQGYNKARLAKEKELAALDSKLDELSRLGQELQGDE